LQRHGAGLSGCEERKRGTGERQKKIGNLKMWVAGHTHTHTHTHKENFCYLTYVWVKFAVPKTLYTRK